MNGDYGTVKTKTSCYLAFPVIIIIKENKICL